MLTPQQPPPRGCSGGGGRKAMYVVTREWDARSVELLAVCMVQGGVES